MTKECQYCRKRKTKDLCNDEGKRDGFVSFIDEDTLYIGGWYERYVGMPEKNIRINFCPMCGRKLKEKESADKEQV